MRGRVNPMRRPLSRSRVLGDQKGATLVEFALTMPVLLVFLMGGLDLGHTLYMQGVLQGQVQKAARDGTIETGTEEARQKALDDRVEYAVKQVARGADVKITRRFYKDFGEAARKEMEPFTDSSPGSPYRNGLCDHGEPFEDRNNNGVWDQDGGNAGQGGAKDDVIYTVVSTFPRLFPIHALIPGMSQEVSITATTVLANQPYGEQTKYGAPTPGNCS